MVAAVAVGTGQMARRDEAPAAEEEGKTPPPLGVWRPRQPTPDHPPYCWMIGEAIDKLGEDGGSTEDSISSFIRAAHPGVPAAHDRFLRHYLAKHVAEGLFVRTAQGRYVRSTDETVVGSSEAARVETPVPQVKRGRGRPRKDGSSSAPPAVKKDGDGGSATPKHRGRPRGVAPLTSGGGSVPSSLVTVLAVKKDGSSSAPPAVKKDGSWGSATPKRRGLVPLTSCDGSVPSSSVAVLAVEKNDSSLMPAAVKKDDSGECTTPRRRGRPRGVTRLASGCGSVPSSSVAVLAVEKNDSSSEPPAVKKDHSGECTTPRRRGRPRGVTPLASGCGSVASSIVASLAVKNASSLMPAAVEKDGGGGSMPPKRRRRPRDIASPTSDDGSVPSSSVGPAAAADKSGSQSQARRRRQLCKLATIIDVSEEEPITEKEDDGIGAPSPTGKDHGRSLELGLVAARDGLAVDNNVCGEAPPTMSMEHDEPYALALLTVTDMSAPMPPMDKQDSGEGKDDIPGMSTVPERRSQASEVAVVADKTDGDEAPSKHKDRHHHRRASPMMTPVQDSAPTSAAGKKARGKTLSATPKAKKDRRRKLAVAANVPVPTGGGNGAPSIVLKPHEGPNRVYPLTADEIPDDPSFCLLALPAQASAHTYLQYFGQ